MNPFPYQRPILPEQVIDRDPEVQKLLSWCDSAMLVRLDAPRRYGKTSLVRKVFHEAGKHAAARPPREDAAPGADVDRA